MSIALFCFFYSMFSCRNFNLFVLKSRVRNAESVLQNNALDSKFKFLLESGMLNSNWKSPTGECSCPSLEINEF